jgi:hypothetical protein
MVLPAVATVLAWLDLGGISFLSKSDLLASDQYYTSTTLYGA